MMTKSRLIALVAEETGMTKKSVSAVCNALFDRIGDSLMEGETVQISGFGSFTVKERSSYVGKHPRTGENMEVPSARAVGFALGRTLKEKINET